MTYLKVIRFHRGEELPAMRLYVIDVAYFVLGDNHRLSMSRCQDTESKKGEDAGD